ncbi:hypothetical protein [Streptomyces griseoruber]|uniref:PBS lyase n=1 Tax=Streptomyces griseoruber TaxID=1943 RepID=A0A101T667_9ACTN|nr:hypothetical protein [Streptomyces griseoruber]KUN86432.1 hypothetical protein AQJ64_10505 [Streptomyces griseoruber]
MSIPPPADWSRLHHAYGRATDVPGQLAGLADPDPAVRHAAVSALTGNVYHQGTRWPASAHVVAPLVTLLDTPGTPDRVTVLRLLRAVAVGDLPDDRLPFDPAQAFAEADRIGPADERAVIRVLFEEDDPDLDSVADVADAVALRWAADAYRAAARHTRSLLGLLPDPDPTVAAHAAALAVWYPHLPGLPEALTAVPHDRTPARASANLALAHLPGPLTRAERGALSACLGSPDATVRLTAAIATARRRPTALPDEALTILVHADAAEVPGSVPGWSRPLRGHTARALRHLGL